MQEPSQSGNVTDTALSIYKQAIESHRRGDRKTSTELCLKSATLYEQVGKDDCLSVVYHRLGKLSYELNDLDAAERWYRKSMEIDEMSGDLQGAALTYNNLSAVFNSRGDFASAEEWLWKSIDIKERAGNERGLTSSYHQMGVVAQTRGDLESAEKWYHKSSELSKQLGDEIGLAHSYGNLSEVAALKEDQVGAQKWQRAALRIFEEHADVPDILRLGSSNRDRGDFQTAEQLFLKALEIAKSNQWDHLQASCYAHLGWLAREQWDIEAAKEWYSMAAAVYAKCGYYDLAANACKSIGNLYLADTADLAPEREIAEEWFEKARGFEDAG